jgi:general secretion pathway protein K
MNFLKKMNMKPLLQRLKYNPLKSKDQKGVALLLAVTSLVLMVYVASEVSMDSTIEYAVNSQELNRIKAYYAARNSADIAMLRVKLFQQASRIQLPPGFAQELDQIWKFPFAWPLPIGNDALSAEKDSIEEKTKAALFDGQYEHMISDEGSKIDINDLASPSKTLREVTAKQLVNIFEQKVTSDEKFREQYQNFKFKDLINRMTDWMSSVNTSANGGDKRGPFQELGEGYPPNRGFRTIDELRLVPGMTEEFFSLLSPHITIYGMKAINPNIASEMVLKSLDTGITDEIIKEIIKRRDDPDEGGPFKGTKDEECRTDFKTFIVGRGARLNDAEFDQIPFLCDKVINFRIQATGRSGSGKGAVQKKINFVVMDINRSATQIKNFIDAEKKAAQGQNPQIDPRTGQPIPPQQQTGQTSAAQKQDPLPKGRPRVVYWSEQ